MSICSCAHKIRSWSNGQVHEYMIFPKVNYYYFRLLHLQIIFPTFYACALCTCHKHKISLAPSQILLHGKTSTIEIRFCNSLEKCIWMSIWHEIYHVLWKLMFCKINIICGKICCATKYALQYIVNNHGIIVGRFWKIKFQHIDFSLSIVNKDNIRHSTAWHMFW